MQERQRNRALYFEELAQTSRKYFIPYLSQFIKVTEGMKVLEIGCGDGGNLLPFAERGCRTTGVDIAAGRIADARRFFAERQMEGEFIAADIFGLKELEHSFDLVICHDVIEHIEDKAAFVARLPHYAKQGGVVFVSFPAWQMPFGGHQQICDSRIASHLPFVHLLPTPVYRALLKACGEKPGRIRELMGIKRAGTSIEQFERLLRREGIAIRHRQLYFINPHYEVKFGLKPRPLAGVIGRVPYLRDFFTTSCFYVL